MNRARFAIVATLVGASFASASGSRLLAQKAPEFKSVLAGKKVEPPFKGQADVEYTQPVTKKNGNNVVTTLKVKNLAPAPLARLKVVETWFDKANNIVGAGETTLEKPLAPGAVERLGFGYGHLHVPLERKGRSCRDMRNIRAQSQLTQA